MISMKKRAKDQNRIHQSGPDQKRLDQKRSDQTGKHKAAASALLACALMLSAAMPLSAYAMPPYDHIPEGCSEETWYRMQDDLVEWDEIGDLVQYYNPTYTKAFDSAQGNVTLLQSAYSDFVREMQDSIETADAALDTLEENQRQLAKLPEGSMIPSADGSLVSRDEALKELKAGLATAKAGRRQLSNAIKKSADSIKNTSKTIERQLQPAKKQLTQAIQGIVITYQQLQINRQMVAEQVKLYETAYNARLNSKNQGLATDLDVLSAKNDLLSAQNSLAKLDSNLETLRRNIGLQLGWDGTKLPEIGEIPDPDVSFVDTTNPDADQTAAIMHNSEVRNAGKVQQVSGIGKTDHRSSVDYSLRDRTENEKTGMLAAKMDSLYADMKQKKALYETAQTTLKKAELTRQAAEKKYQLGMLGRAEYEGQQLAYTSYEAAIQLAKLNLFQSINTYRWAVDGYTTLDE